MSIINICIIQHEYDFMSEYHDGNRYTRITRKPHTPSLMLYVTDNDAFIDVIFMLYDTLIAMILMLYGYSIQISLQTCCMKLKLIKGNN